MRLPIILRRTHKWLALIVGIQVIFWTLGGLYMTAVHIDTIHGDHLVRDEKSKSVDVDRLMPPQRVAAAIPTAQQLRLVWRFDRLAYVVDLPGASRAFDAISGAALPALNDAQVRALAQRRFAGREAIANTALLNVAPPEVASRPVPIWRVEFAGWDRPTFYFSPASGELLARRHTLWRVFDFVWMLHIMDYADRSDVNNLLLRVFTWAAVALALSGATMLIWSFPRRRWARAARPMRLSPLLFRRLHKWIGLALGAQFILWAVSGTAMALLDKSAVEGGAKPAAQALTVSASPGDDRGWLKLRGQLPGGEVTGLTIRPLLGRGVIELHTATDLHVFDATTGERVKIDAAAARSIAKQALSGMPPVRSVLFERTTSLETREHAAPLWRVDFADAENTSVYIDAATGKVLERRTDSWRIWDLFWMLHNMDYLERKSFNHPLIVIVAAGIVWLALTGAYLVFKSFGTADLRWAKTALRRRM